MGCLRYPRKQTSANAAVMTDPDPNPLFADGCTVIACYRQCEARQQAPCLKGYVALMTRLSNG
jgi:hypothetical protein